LGLYNKEVTGITLTRFWCALAFSCGLISSALMLTIGLKTGLIALFVFEVIIGVAVCIFGSGREGFNQKIEKS
jgi:hypothetical protein